MKKHLLTAALGLLIPMAAYLAYRSLPKHVSAAAAPQQPFTVYSHEEFVSPQHPRYIINRFTFAIRKDGSTSRSVEQTETGFKRRDVERFHENLGLVILDDVAVVSTYHLPPGDADRRMSIRLDPATDCREAFMGGKVNTLTFLGTETRVNGMRADKFKTGMGIIQYRYPDIGCEPLESHFDWQNPGTSETFIDSIVPGDPDPSLFSAPANYAETKPSEAYLKQANEGGPNHAGYPAALKAKQVGMIQMHAAKTDAKYLAPTNHP